MNNIIKTEELMLFYDRLTENVKQICLDASEQIKFNKMVLTREQKHSLKLVVFFC